MPRGLGTLCGTPVRAKALHRRLRNCRRRSQSGCGVMVSACRCCTRRCPWWVAPGCCSSMFVGMGSRRSVRPTTSAGLLLTRSREVPNPTRDGGSGRRDRPTTLGACSGTARRIWRPDQLTVGLSILSPICDKTKYVSHKETTMAARKVSARTRRSAQELGERCAEWRKLQNLTAEQVAQRAGVPVQRCGSSSPALPGSASGSSST